LGGSGREVVSYIIVFALNNLHSLT
jgi:hypothetical protein